MGKVIVIQFITLDGVVEDPDGRGGSPIGGWAFRDGPAAIAGDKFRLGPVLDSGVLLFGRRTWEHFSHLWPTRTDPFAAAMNAAAKVVVTTGSPDLSAWQNSTLLGDDLLDGVRRLAERRDVVVIGSTSVVHALAKADAVDEYRLVTIPVSVGEGAQLFAAPVDLEPVSAERSDPGVLTCYRVRRAS